MDALHVAAWFVIVVGVILCAGLYVWTVRQSPRWATDTSADQVANGDSTESVR